MPGILILMYHRVIEMESDPWALCVTPRNFEEHLQIVRSWAISLTRLRLGLKEGKRPAGAIVITFDDGYADNLYNAKVLLERWDVPATIFAVAGAIGRDREFWWDRLERVFLQPGTLPSNLFLRVNGKDYVWELGEAAYYSVEAAALGSSWRACQDAGNVRQHLYRTIWQLLRPLNEIERSELISAIESWAGTKVGTRASHRVMSFDELNAVAEGGLIEIGAHSWTHPNLSSLPMYLQRDEISQSKAFLEKSLGKQVSSFAYPYGSYTPETVSLVREAGFVSACSTLPALVDGDTDVFQLPRFGVLDWNGEEFERQLSRWAAATSIRV